MTDGFINLSNDVNPADPVMSEDEFKPATNEGFVVDTEALSPVGDDVVTIQSVMEIAAQEYANGHDPVNHPQHYKRNPSGIEVIEITRHLNFNRGNAVKYILRADHKGNTVQDLEKAAWYINDEIERIKQFGE